MILQSLAKYYDILAQDEQSGIPRPGYGMVNVSYALVLSKNGELINVLPLKNKNAKGKEIPQKRLVPEPVKKTSGVSSNFLCENSSYMLGVDKKGKPERAKQCFESFKALHVKLLSEVDCDAARAVVSYVTNWDPDKAGEHEALTDCLDELCDGGGIVFRLDGSGFIHEDQLVLAAWERYKNAPSSSAMLPCLVTGELAPAARLHPSIKGVRGAQSVGAAIVSFNARAYDSYGRNEEQGLNAPVSERATFAYTTVLNHLIADSAHRLFLGDTTVVFWAETTDPGYQDYAAMLFDPSELEEKNLTSAPVRDERAVREVKGVLKKIANGAPIGNYTEAFDNNVSFYVLGISPNAARLAVRFFVCDSFGRFVEKTALHYEHLRIQKRSPKEPDILSLWRLLNETVSPKASDKSPSPLLAGSVLRAILTGQPYPTQLFNAVLTRIRAGDEISYCKAAIIKAYLIRKNIKTGKNKEELTVGLNKNSDNKAYLFGRLFAVLEKAQLDANRGINSTIKDRYFTSACSTPASVFPNLVKLSQNHTSKGEYGKVYEKLISEIYELMKMEGQPYPPRLTSEEQGVFILGYYHQHNSFYAKKEDNKEDKES